MNRGWVALCAVAAMGLVGCATQEDFEPLKANVATASEGAFGACIENVYASGSALATARSVLQRGERDGQVYETQYQVGLRASEDAIRYRKLAEEACGGRLAAVEESLQRTKDIMRGVTFATGSAELSDKAKANLDRVANELLRAPTLVEVRGYTSNTGSREANMALSQRRADTVRAYLISRGVADDTITARGYGPADPVAANDTPEGRRANQRIDLRYATEPK